MTQTYSHRRYDLDWLRVIAFGLLIIYHVGMYYVTWDWHVKSPYAGDFLEPAMRLLNPWRLPLLFVISGIAVKFAVDKAATGQFAWARTKRLLVPFFFGALVVVPPQTYFELLHDGVIAPGYWDFYQGYVDLNQRWDVFTPTYNHLWYVLYVLLYTLLLLPFLAVARRVGSVGVMQRVLASPFVLCVPAFLFLLLRFTSDAVWPETHDIRNDWGAHLRYGSYFLVGVMVAKSDAFWRGIASYWKWAAGLAGVSGIVLASVWAGWGQLVVDGPVMQAARALRIFYIWWVLCALLGFGQAYLNRPSRALSYLTDAVFPYYILHQTITILAGVFLAPYLIGAVPEFIAVMLITGLGCAMFHEYLIRRVSFLRPLFGLKPKTRPELTSAQAKA